MEMPERIVIIEHQALLTLQRIAASHGHPQFTMSEAARLAFHRWDARRHELHLRWVPLRPKGRAR